jgi:hypothetical protein
VLALVSARDSDAASRPWAIVTERRREVERRGVGVVELQATLEHLRLRGDDEAQYEFTDECSGWKTVNLRTPLPNGGSHRAS